LCLMCGKSGDWAARIAGCRRGGGGRVSLGGEANPAWT